MVDCSGHAELDSVAEGTNMEDSKKDAYPNSLSSPLCRRDLMKKLGAGVVATALSGSVASSQQGEGNKNLPPVPPPGSPPPNEWRPHTGPGYINTANRLGGNGP